MITVHNELTCVVENRLLRGQEIDANGIESSQAKTRTLAAQILEAHNTAHSTAPDAADRTDDTLSLRFDALASHDITYVGIIQTARASGLTHFPLPYVLTNCHNSLCAVGGTINEDDHLFGLSAAQKYGGTYVPPNMAVIHQYVREALVKSGGMILGSDSHTRYGALGVMGIGEGGPELVKQLVNKTYDIKRPKVICVWLHGHVTPGVGPQDIALALIQSVFASGFVKNAVLEFHGPGIRDLSVEYRCGIDVMTTETTCLSSIWETDEAVYAYYAAHGRADAYKELVLRGPAVFDGCVDIDLSRIEPMIALPFHPANAYPIRDVIAHADDYLGQVEEKAVAQYGELGKKLALRDKVRDHGIWVEQGVIAGCAGGSFENLALAANILEGGSIGCGAFSLSLYPASQIIALDLVKQGYYAKAMQAGAILKNAFCGPCFGAGDTPANACLSIRHSTRNFPNREGSKPSDGQIAAVALMDARSIAATARNGGRLTPATDLPEAVLSLNAHHTPDMGLYKKRIFSSTSQGSNDLILGPNITDWPAMQPLPTHLVLRVASHITDPVTTTDELIPSGETSSLRSNPLKLAQFTLSRKDPGYVARATNFKRLQDGLRAGAPEANEFLERLMSAVPDAPKPDASLFGFGTTIFAMKPGDGSAREQAASCQKVLGGWANLAVDYATKRYRSNLINWGMLPFLLSKEDGLTLSVGDYIVLFDIRAQIGAHALTFPAWHILDDMSSAKKITLHMQDLTDAERDIILAGCLINYYQKQD